MFAVYSLIFFAFALVFDWCEWASTLKEWGLYSPHIWDNSTSLAELRSVAVLNTVGGKRGYTYHTWAALPSSGTRHNNPHARVPGKAKVSLFQPNNSTSGKSYCTSVLVNKQRRVSTENIASSSQMYRCHGSFLHVKNWRKTFSVTCLSQVTLQCGAGNLSE